MHTQDNGGHEDAIPANDEPWMLVPDLTVVHAKGSPKSTKLRNEVELQSRQR